MMAFRSLLEGIAALADIAGFRQGSSVPVKVLGEVTWIGMGSKRQACPDSLLCFNCPMNLRTLLARSIQLTALQEGSLSLQILLRILEPVHGHAPRYPARSLFAESDCLSSVG